MLESFFCKYRSFHYLCGIGTLSSPSHSRDTYDLWNATVMVCENEGVLSSLMVFMLDGSEQRTIGRASCLPERESQMRYPNVDVGLRCVV
jgi:hypothetical protein